MRIFKKTFIFIYVLVCITTLGLGIAVAYYNNQIQNEFILSKGSDLIIDSFIPVTAEHNGKVLKDCDAINKPGENIKVDLKLLGVIPVKSANVKVVEDTFVAVLGTPFGIKMYTEGVLVTELSDIETENGTVSPAKKAGIKVGDYILSVNDVVVSSNEDLGFWIEDSNGMPLSLKIKRDDKVIYIKLTPVFSKTDNLFRAGIWVKDSSAGIGTLTFYSPQCNIVCGLGHAVYDSATKEILNFNNGELVSASIASVNKGAAGVAGELNGVIGYSSIAQMQANTINGVYGVLNCRINTENLTQIAFSSEIKSGAAQILCTVKGDTPKFYDCEIKVKNTRVNNTVQNMSVTITDPELISITGGIVQGMSGSPILQNGKLIGAVTHVLIDDPTKGYAIFAENMIKTAQSVSQQQLKEVS